MKKELFLKLKPEKGQYCTAVFIVGGKKITENCIKFSGYEHGNIYLDTENWARDYYMVPLKNLLFIKKA